MLKTVMAGATAALALAAASTASAVTTFATYDQVDPTAKPFTWVDNSAGGGTLTASGVAVTLNIAGMGPQAATFNFSGAIPSGPPAFIDGGIDTFFMPGLAGTFSFTGAGSTNLLSGTFSGGVLTVEGTSGNARATTVTGDTVVYTSSVIPLASLGAPRDFSFALTAISPAASINPVGGGIANFTATGSGNFSATPITGVPEPAGWALMIVGIGGLGAVLRRRRHTYGAFAA